MNRIFSASLALLISTSVMAQDNDPVIMRVNGRPITRSEFEYSFNKNNADGVIDKKGLNDYVPLFVNYQLKVEEARQQKIDTMSSIRQEINGYKEQLVMPELVDNDLIEREARRTYDETKKRFGDDDMLNASHILLMLKQDATDAEAQAIKQRADSIYNALKNGADFAELAKKYSDDKGSAINGGRLPEFGKGMMVPEFEKAAYALQKGELSQPFTSAYGYHIILMHDRHPFEPYEHHHEAILRFLEQRGIKDISARMHLDSLVKRSSLTREEVIDSLAKTLEAKDLEMKYLSKEYTDGTLMFAVCKQDVWDKAAADEQGLEKFFKKNKKNYAWTEPHFRGIVVHAKNDSAMNVAKGIIAKVKDQEQWAETIVKQLNNDSVRLVRIERGVYKKGDNAYVDYTQFGGAEKHINAFPVTASFGKVLSKPETYKDVKGQVTSDYQNECEKIWVEGLRKKYPVEIDEKVLSTVNNH